MHEIILPVSELKKARPGLSKAVANKTPLPVLQSVRVARDANGQLSILATDLDSFATFNVNAAQPGPALALLVPFGQLTRIVKGMKAEETIGFIPEGKERIKLRCFIAGHLVEQNLPTWAADEFPRVPEVNQPSVPLDPEFGTALRQALECCGTGPARPILNGACLDATDHRFQHLVGTNGKVLFSANSFAFDLQNSVIIPDSKFLAWTGFMDEKPGLLSVEPGQEPQPAKDGQAAKGARPGYVKLQSGQWTFITEVIEGKFPDWKHAVPTPNSNWTRIHLSGEAMKQLLLVTPILPGDDQPDRPVRLRVDRCLTIEGQDKNDGEWTSVPVQTVNVTGGSVSVALNREDLLKALRFGLNKLEIEDALSPVAFSNANSSKTMIIMPVNLDEGRVTGQATAQSSSEAPTPPTHPTTPEEQPALTTEESCSKCSPSADALADGELCGNRQAEAEERRLAIIEMARREHQKDGEVEIDDDATLSEGADNGCYVQAWVWVGFSDTTFDKEKEIMNPGKPPSDAPREHLFSPHTDLCVYCGRNAQDDAIENMPCSSDQPPPCPGERPNETGNIAQANHAADSPGA